MSRGPLYAEDFAGEDVGARVNAASKALGKRPGVGSRCGDGCLSDSGVANQMF